METYYYLYRITNLINGKIYVGVHKTNDLDDGYMGSGLLIKRAINKYGIENFEKSILQFFNTPDSAFEAESQIVDEEFVADTSTYNIKDGGNGGWDHLNRSGILHRTKSKQQISKSLKEYYSGHPERIAEISRMNSELHKCGKMKAPSFAGRQHTEATKRKMSVSSKGKCCGERNGNFNKCWIYSLDLKQSKSVPKPELDYWLTQGWIKGRKIKFQ